jgi:hypothetical protein
MDILNGGDDVVRPTDIVLEAPSRQVMKAKKIMNLQEEVGVNIREDREEHVKRLEMLEGRDKAEKEGWELNRASEGFQ